MPWFSQIWLFFQALAAKTRQKGIKLAKPEDQIWRGLYGCWCFGTRNPSTAILQEGMKANAPAARFDYFFQLWQSKPVKKESKSPNQKIRIIEVEMNWINQIWLLFQSLAAKTCAKGIKVTIPKRPELPCFESGRFDYFFNRWRPKPVQKSSKSPNRKIRIIEIEMNWIRQIWLLFQSLAAKTRPKGIKVTKPEDQKYRHWNELNQADLITFSIFGSQNPSKRNQSHQTRRSAEL